MRNTIEEKKACVARMGHSSAIVPLREPLVMGGETEAQRRKEAAWGHTAWAADLPTGPSLPPTPALWLSAGPRSPPG